MQADAKTCRFSAGRRFYGGGTERGNALEHEFADMTILDLAKATVVCGSGSFLVFSFPVLGQVLMIGILSLLWLLYAYKTFASLRRK